MIYNTRIQYNYQNNPIWKDEIMTQGYNWTDYIGRWGCITTCLSNILSAISNKSITPKDMNDIIIRINAYKYLNDKSTKESNASEIVWENIKKYFSKSLKINNWVETENYKNNIKNYYIARINLLNGSHYINILKKIGNNFLVYDVLDGIVKLYNFDEIIVLHEIIKL